MTEKILPTERLTSVLLEALDLLAAHQTLRTGAQELVRQEALLTKEELLSGLRSLLDSSPVAIPTAILESAAYLRIHGKRLASSRAAQRKKRGDLGPGSSFDPSIHIPASAMTPLVAPAGFSLEDIEAKLKGLSLSGDEE